MIRFATIGSNFIVDQMLDAAGHCPGFAYEAVYSRTQQRAGEFAAKYGVSKTYTSLDALAGDNHVDAVYIASPNLCHKEQAIALMRAGKHVLCEKPMAICESDGGHASRPFARPGPGAAADGAYRHGAPGHAAVLPVFLPL